MLVGVESSDKRDISTLARDCTDEEFRTIEANETQKIVQQQTREQKGFEVWPAIVGRDDQWNVSGKKLSSCSTDRQLDDILRTLVHETNEFEKRCDKIRDEDKNNAVVR